MSAPDPTPHNDQLLEEAAAWFARMRGPDAEAHSDEFEAWLRRGALHRQAYNRASEIFAMGKHLREPDRAPPADKAATAPARPRLLVPLATILILAVAAWFLLGDRFRQSAAGQVAEGRGDADAAGQRVATNAGETRSTRLLDGSIIDLRPDTSIDVRFDRQVRRLVLQRGAARFSVAHEARPLVVEAGGGQIRALGTLFDLGIAADGRVSVHLIQGSVEVTPPGTGVPRRLSAGQSTSFAGRRPGAASGRPEHSGAASASPASGRGEAREYDNVPLAELVALANRDSARRLVLDDPAIGALRVSGRFSTADPSLLAERLALLFDLVRADDRNGNIVLRRR